MTKTINFDFSTEIIQIFHVSGKHPAVCLTTYFYQNTLSSLSFIVKKLK